MKDLFYKVEMRMGKVSFSNSSKTQIIMENNYFNEGCCLVQKNEIKGILTGDFFHITINENLIYFSSIIFSYDENMNIIGKKYNFKILLDYDFFLLIKLLLVAQDVNGDEILGVALNFSQEEKDLTKQEELIEELKKINQL